MDRRAFLAAALSAAAGCGSGGDASRTVAPNLQGEPSPSPTPTPPPTATPTPGAQDRPREVVLMNPTLHEVDLDVRVSRDGETVLEGPPHLRGATQYMYGNVLEPDGTYDVAVGTGDGRSRTFEWRPSDEGGDLHLSLRNRIVIRHSYDADVVGAFVTGDTGVLRDGRERDWSFLVLENPNGTTEARIEFSDDDWSASATIDAPERSLLWLPVSVPSATFDVDVTVDGTAVHTAWREEENGQLHLALDGPQFSCDRLYRDLRVLNQTDEEWSPRVSVLTDGRTAFTETVPVEPGGTESVPAAVPPAYRYAVRVESDGERSTFELPECPPVGPIDVTRDADGIDVAVRALEGTGVTTAAEPGTGNERETGRNRDVSGTGNP